MGDGDWAPTRLTRTTRPIPANSGLDRILEVMIRMLDVLPEIAPDHLNRLAHLVEA